MAAGMAGLRSSRRPDCGARRRCLCARCGLLESALARPLNAFAYGVEDIFDLAALYAAGVVKNHPFVDGNKRTGFILSELFLNANGWSLYATDEDVIACVLLLAGGEWDEQQYAVWLRENSSPKGG